MKKRLLNFLLKHLFNAITEDDVLKYHKKNGKFYLGKNEVGGNRIISFRSQAITIKESTVWELLLKDMKLIANKKMYESSTTIDDVVFGKAMLYTLDVLDKKIDSLSKLK